MNNNNKCEDTESTWAGWTAVAGNILTYLHLLLKEKTQEGQEVMGKGENWKKEEGGEE